MQNLLCIVYEKTLLLNPVIFREDYRVVVNYRRVITPCQVLRCPYHQIIGVDHPIVIMQAIASGNR